MEYQYLNEELSISSINEDELLVTLSDMSQWMVKPSYISKIAIWYETQRIVVSKNDSEPYPYLLTNLDTAEPDRVEASIA